MAAAIVDNHLLLMSANYTFYNGLPSSQELQLYWLNLNSTINVDGFIPKSLLTTTPSPSDELLGITNHRGTFFYDHSMLCAYAGIISSDSNGASNSLWAFNTTTNKWSSTIVGGGDYQFYNNSEGEHTSIPATDQSFYTGGFSIAISGTYDGLIAFNSRTSPT